MTITIELPEDLAARLAKMPESERPNFAIAAMRLQSEPEEAELDEETLSRMRLGLAQVDSGEMVSWEAHLQERRAARQNRQ